MIGGRLINFAYFLFLSLYANHALAHVTNITFSDHPTTCSDFTVSWKGGTPPFTVVFSILVDALAQPGPNGPIQGFPVQVAETGNARSVVWTAAVQAGEVLVAVIRDGLQRNFVSPKRVVQASNDVTCLSALTSMDTSTAAIVLPSLSTRPIGTSTNLISSATVVPVEASSPLITNQHIIVLPVLLTLFTIGNVIGISVYGFYIYRSGAPRRPDTRYDDIEGGGNTALRVLGTYSKELGRNITRKISAMSPQISRRPTAVVATEKPESFTIQEETSPPTPQEVLQPSSGDLPDVEEPSLIIGVPIMTVGAISAPRPTSSVTISTTSGMTETGTGLSPPRPISIPNGKGLRPAPSKSNIRGLNRPLPIPPALDLSRQGTQREYGLPTANSRLEATRPRSRSKSAIVADPNHERISSPTRRRASAGAVVALDSPPTHFAQVPISALPPATSFSFNTRSYSQISGYRSVDPATRIQSSSRRRPNTMGSIIVVQDVPFVIESPIIPRFSQPTTRFGAESRTSFATGANVLEPFVIPSSSPRSDAGSHVDPFYDIPQTATTTLTRYSMALPESGSLLPASFSVAQDERVPPLPSAPVPLPRLANMPNSRPISPTSGDDPLGEAKREPMEQVTRRVVWL